MGVLATLWVVLERSRVLLSTSHSNAHRTGSCLAWHGTSTQQVVGSDLAMNAENMCEYKSAVEAGRQKQSL